MELKGVKAPSFCIKNRNFAAKLQSDKMKKNEITGLFQELLEKNNGKLDLVAKMKGSYTLEAQGLVKRYGKRTVVNDVNYTVRQGEIVGLLGPNGAGKTTSFYMTTGLVLPNGGKVFINDGKERREITNYPVYKRAQEEVGIGYLAQEASVFRKMTVEDNIFSVLEMRHVKPTIPEDYIRRFSYFTEYDWKYFMMEDLINEFRLNKVRHNKGDQLSGGERRRCEIARCLAINPRFIMLDEPFAGVDPIAVEDIQFIVWNLKKRNIGILITDHNVDETLTITDRAYLLFEGRILFHGSPEELAENKVVREKYLTNSFVLRKKDFQLLEEERRKKEEEGMASK
jgi:lipopolysaccharide export system ATP-binding protein